MKFYTVKYKSNLWYTIPSISFMFSIRHKYLQIQIQILNYTFGIGWNELEVDEYIDSDSGLFNDQNEKK